MKYLSVCSGIEAATAAWHPLGWQPVGFSEIEPFPSSVLAHHHPHVPNHGDFTNITARPGDFDLLVGGTPCQSFSVAGRRGGMADDRGNLALEFVRLAERARPRWLVWENVPGVLSSGHGRDFGSLLGALVDVGYGFAYRVLDAQRFGVPQRRRRVFLVGHLGDWRRAAAVLFEPACLRRDPPTRRDERDAAAFNAEGRAGVPYFTASNLSKTVNNQTPLVLAFAENQRAEVRYMDVVPSIATGGGKPGVSYPAVLAFHHAQDPVSSASAFPAMSKNARGMGVLSAGVPRRLTPREVERCFGFEDDYTLIPGATDTKRYRALGNSMAVPVMRWIGERIAKVDAL